MPLPLSLYIHVPWCIKKCPYCDFNSHVHAAVEPLKGDELISSPAPLPEMDYLQALLQDFKQDRQLLEEPRPLQSIFIGGGTPSLLSANFYALLIDALREQITFASDIEITLEANPGTVDQANFAGFRRAGINRLSIGVQSFSNDALQKLGRIHNGDDAVRAYVKARDAGFDNINLDLMHGLPMQLVSDAEADLQQAIDLQPEHISWYQLTIEQNTAFYNFPPTLPNENTLGAIQDAGFALLAKNSYEQYEVSAFSRAGRASMHNLNYWMLGDYLGIGAGAHGKLSYQGKVTRRWKTRMPNHYLANSNKLAGEQAIDAVELPLEFMLNALRLKKGFAKELFAARTGLDLNVVAGKIDSLVERHLLIQDVHRIAASGHGWLFLNDLIAEFS